MPPYAICITDHCSYLFDCKDDNDEVPPLVPPVRCPICNGKIVSYCKVCAWPIHTAPTEKCPRCENCSAKLQQDIPLMTWTVAPRKKTTNISRPIKTASDTMAISDVVSASPPKMCHQVQDLDGAGRNSSCDPKIQSPALRYRKAV